VKKALQFYNSSKIQSKCTKLKSLSRSFFWLGFVLTSVSL